MTYLSEIIAYFLRFGSL